MSDPEQIYGESFRAGIRPDPVLRVSEWADAHRVLPQRAAAEPGPWRTSRTPYLREIMDRLSPSDPTQIVVLMKGSQLGGTECGNNWLGFSIDCAPGPIMMVQPTVEMAKRVSKQRIAAMIEDCPRLREKVSDARSRDSGNTILAKEFPGGILVITGANSAVGLRSMPVRNLFLDEVDGYDSDVDGEGDPVELAMKRTSTFRRNRKVLIVSTPTVKDLSRIEKAFLRSDQRRFHVPCPVCGTMAPLLWRNIEWPQGHPEQAAYRCESCQALIPEHHKTMMLEQGRWIAQAEGDGVTAGYHLSALYSPLGWYSWAEMARDFLIAKREGPEKLKTWVNTCLGETWEESGETVDEDSLLSRREDYPAEVPGPVLVLTAGVDVQDDRLEVEIVGWRTGEESWGIAYRVLWGDPDTPPGDPESPWAQLDDLLNSSWEREDGTRLKIIFTCIDSAGHRTEAVYRYVRDRQWRGVYATVGRAGAGRPIISAPAAKKQGRSHRPVKLFTVGVDEGKGILFARLKGREPGPGYCHFPIGSGYDAGYFLQLTAEKRVIRYVKGFPKAEWIKVRARNEALDCRVQAHAALCLLNPHWRALERRVGVKRAEAPEQPQDEEPTPTEKKPPARPSWQQEYLRKRKARNSWMNRWRY